MIVTIVPRNAAAMSDDSRVEGVALSEALSRSWPWDAHFVAYEPRTVPVLGTDRRAVVRLLHETHEERPAVYDVLDVLDVPNVRMVALVGDVDAPNHSATPEWRAEVVPRLEASGLAYYETRGGYRVLAEIDFEIASRQDADTWKELYQGWIAYLKKAHDLDLDPACKDWTRLYRLPNVIRDGKACRAVVHGTPPQFDPDRHWIQPAATTAAHAPRASAANDATEARARAIAERLPPSVEGLGGDEALFRAACELATVLGEDAEAIENVLAETFNPRCLPPWPAAKLRYEAARAAERQATPEARFARRRAETPETRPAVDPSSSPLHSFGRQVDRAHPPPPLVYVIEDLDLAPGKVSAIQAFANVAKTPFALLMAICVAAGKPFLGFETKQCPTMFLAFEGGILTEEREARLCAGLGLKREDVPLDFWHIEASIDEHFLHALELHVTERGVGMIVIDTYGSALPGDIEHNSDKFSHWLKQLGRLSDATGALVVVLLHENKGAGDGLRKISGHNSAPGAIQAAIGLERTDTSDRSVIDVYCSREVRKAFEPFRVRFDDVPHEGAPTGQALTVTRQDTAKAAKAAAPVNVQRKEQAEADTREAGENIWKQMRAADDHYSDAQLRSIGAVGANAANRAIARLRSAGLIELRHGAYTLSDEGRAAGSIRVHNVINGTANVGKGVGAFTGKGTP